MIVAKDVGHNWMLEVHFDKELKEMHKNTTSHNNDKYVKMKEILPNDEIDKTRELLFNMCEALKVKLKIKLK